MAWVRLDDGFPQHPKIAGLSDAAFRAHVTALCYCGRFWTDGQLTVAIASAIVKSKHVLSQLLSAGVWSETPEGYEIHDFLQYNQSRKQHQELMAKRMASGIAGAEARWRGPDGKSQTAPHVSPSPSPSRPLPNQTRPDQNPPAAAVASAAPLPDSNSAKTTTDRVYPPMVKPSR